MNKTKIDWADMTWNPVTGCLHGCEYCYARKIANRFGAHMMLISGGQLATLEEPDKFIMGNIEIRNSPYPFDFLPTFHRYRLNEPAGIKTPQNIFVCSMADLYGDWVPDEWIQEVFKACEAAPQHNYLFLTKATNRYSELYQKGILPTGKNYWYGTTVTNRDGDVYDRQMPFNTFASIEPLLEDLGKGNTDRFPGWIIIGAETGNRKGKVIPEKHWIEEIAFECKVVGIPVFMKESLKAIMGADFIQEFPEGLKHHELQGGESV